MCWKEFFFAWRKKLLSRGIHVHVLVVHLQAFPDGGNSCLFVPIIGNLSISSKMSTQVVEFSSWWLSGLLSVSYISIGHMYMYVEIDIQSDVALVQPAWCLVCTVKGLISLLLLFLSIKVVALLPSQEALQTCLKLGLTRVSLCVFKCMT